MDYRAAESRRRSAASSAAKRRRQQHPLGRQGDVRTVMMASSHDEDSARCTICQRQPHQFEECREVWHMSVARRREEVRRLGLCFACMRPGHRAFDCEANCTACGRRHHVMLHEMRERPAPAKPPLPHRALQAHQHPPGGSRGIAARATKAVTGAMTTNAWAKAKERALAGVRDAGSAVPAPNRKPQHAPRLQRKGKPKYDRVYP